jgi:hypothetical protein
LLELWNIAGWQNRLVTSTTFSKGTSMPLIEIESFICANVKLGIGGIILVRPIWIGQQVINTIARAEKCQLSASSGQAKSLLSCSTTQY